MPPAEVPHGSGVAFAVPHAVESAARAAAAVATADSCPAWMLSGLNGGAACSSGRARCAV